MAHHSVTRGLSAGYMQKLCAEVRISAPGRRVCGVFGHECAWEMGEGKNSHCVPFKLGTWGIFWSVKGWQIKIPISMMLPKKCNVCTPTKRCDLQEICYELLRTTRQFDVSVLSTGVAQVTLYFSRISELRGPFMGNRPEGHHVCAGLGLALCTPFSSCE